MEVSNFRLTEAILELPEITSVSQDQVTPYFSCVCKVRARNAKGKDRSKFITTDSRPLGSRSLSELLEILLKVSESDVITSSQE